MNHHKPSAPIVDRPPEESKPFPADFNMLGKRRLDALLDLCDRIGITRLFSFSELFGKIRESRQDETYFDQKFTEDFLVNGKPAKAEIIFYVEYTESDSADKPNEIPCGYCGKPLVLKSSNQMRKYHPECYAALARGRQIQHTLNNLKNGVCNHYSHGKKQKFPCKLCLNNARRLGYNIETGEVK